MKNREELCEVEDNLLEELAGYSGKKRFGNGELERLVYLAKGANNIGEIVERGDKERVYSQLQGYSRAGDWMARGRFGMPYDEDGNSYANSGQHYVRGHYSREGGRDRMTRGGYSRDDGREEMLGELEDMMRGADERQRGIIQRAMDELRSA